MAAAPKENHPAGAHGLINPDQAVHRIYEQSLRRRIRVFDAWIRKLEGRFCQASNRRSGGLMRIMDAIEQNQARRATLYAQLQNHLQQRRQQATARNINDHNNINNNSGGGAPPELPEAGNAGNKLFGRSMVLSTDAECSLYC